MEVAFSEKKILSIAYLNLNSQRNKTNDLRNFIQDIPLAYFVLSETKLDSSFPTSQFHIPGYQIRAMRDRNKYGGGLTEYVKKSVICKKFKNLKRSHINLFVQN